MSLNHILFIPDGNRRWAKKRNQNPWEGHRAGAESFKDLLYYVAKNNVVKNISFWAMSKDNFDKRPKKEISFLIKIINEAFKTFAKDDTIKERGINIRFYGAWDKIFDKKTIQNLKQIEKNTKNNKNFFLSILLAYDGKDELITGLNTLSHCKKITEKDIKNSLWTKDLPDVDLIIRTGVKGDPHLSGNILLWQTSYSQLYFSELEWPDFKVNELKEAVADFNKRERRKGK